MDSLKTLMEKNQYDLVIKLTENSNDSISLFYRLSALVAVGKNNEALELIKNKRNMFQSRLNLLIKFHIEILLKFELFHNFADGFGSVFFELFLPGLFVPYFEMVGHAQNIGLAVKVSEFAQV